MFRKNIRWRSVNFIADCQLKFFIGPQRYVRELIQIITSQCAYFLIDTCISVLNYLRLVFIDGPRYVFCLFRFVLFFNDKKLIMHSIDIDQVFDTSIADQVFVIRANTLSLTWIIPNGARSTLVKFSTRVRQIWVNELKPCHVDPILFLLGFVLQL